MSRVRYYKSTSARVKILFFFFFFDLLQVWFVSCIQQLNVNVTSTSSVLFFFFFFFFPSLLFYFFSCSQKIFFSDAPGDPFPFLLPRAEFILFI